MLSAYESSPVCSATAAAEKGLQEAVQRAEAAERSASQAQLQLQENGRRHAAASASLEVRVSPASLLHHLSTHTLMGRWEHLCEAVMPDMCMVRSNVILLTYAMECTLHADGGCKASKQK